MKAAFDIDLNRFAGYLPVILIRTRQIGQNG